MKAYCRAGALAVAMACGCMGKPQGPDVTDGREVVLDTAQQPATPVDRTEDLRQIIESAVASGKKRIIVPPGRYRLKPRERQHLVLEGLSDTEIIADGVEMVCTETTRALTLSNCRNVTIRGLTIDYDPLPFTQGRIVSLSEDKRIHTLELQEGYPAADTVQAGKYEIFDAASLELTSTTYYGIQVKALGPRRLQVTKPQHHRPADATEKPGDLVVIASRHAPGGSIPHAIFIKACENVTLQGVRLYASNSFGFLEVGCTRSRYLECRVDRRGSRLRSLNADAFHSKLAPIGPVYRGCLARYMGDDGIAINGHYHLVTGTDGTRLRVVGKNGEKPNLAVGDPVELVSFSGVRLPDARVVAIEPAGALTEAETTFLRKQRLSPPMRTKMLKADQVTQVVLDRAVNLPMGSLLAAANRQGNGFEVTGCTIGPNRSRGILVKAGNGSISTNRLVGNWGMAIKLAPEYYWFEAGSGSNVTIEKNTITDCRDAAIAVYATGGNGITAPAGAHRDIRIVGNTISNSPNPAIAVTSTAGLLLKDNQIRNPSTRPLVPWLARSFGRQEDPDRQVYLKNVERAP